MRAAQPSTNSITPQDSSKVHKAHSARRLASRLTGLETAADLAHGLAQSLLILDQRQPQVAFTSVAEAAARTDRHLGFLQQLHREIDRAHLLSPFFGVARPDEHACFRR